MHLDHDRLGPTFFAEVTNVDIRQPLGDAVIGEIKELIAEEGVLLFRAPGLTDEEQIAFSERLGPLEGGSLLQGRKRAEIDPRIADLTNVAPDGSILPNDHHRLQFQKGNQFWHTDSSFKEVPARYSLLRAEVIPGEGGDTEWADLRAAWRALPKEKQETLDGLVAEHSLLYSRSLYGFTDFNEEELEQFKPALQALVRTHPDTGEKNLFLGAHASHIVGRDVEEGRALLKELTEFAVRPEFTYRHQWTQGDLVMWDNRRVMHRGHPWPEDKLARIMRRTTVAGARPTVRNGRPVNEYEAAKSENQAA